MIIVLYVAILGILLVLGILSRKEPLVSEEPVPDIMKPFRRMAVRIYRRFRNFQGRKGRKGQMFPGSQMVRADLSILDPSRKAKKRAILYYISKIQNLLLIITAGVLLAIAVWYSGRQEGLISSSGAIERPGADESGMEIQIAAETNRVGKTEEIGEYTVQISAQEYSEEQTDQLSDQLFGQLPDRIRGDNRDLSCVTENLDLVKTVDGYPFRISWESSRYELLDTDGTVGNAMLAEGTHADVMLTAALKYKDRKYENSWTVTIYPRILSEEEQFDADIEQALSDQDEATAKETHYYLPENVNGFPIIWKERKEDNSLMLFGICLAAGIVIFIMSDRDLHRRIEKRERQMILDYPQVVSKMVLLTGAGMSVPNAFFRIGQDYMEGRKKGGESHYVYEEILLMCRELKSGISESDALTHFGKRCRSRRYTKFCSLLAQNQKKGNGALLKALQEEADEAFNDRRNIARQMGEEAGTKLLLPMVMMLAVTLVIIIIPAYFSFSI